MTLTEGGKLMPIPSRRFAVLRLLSAPATPVHRRLIHSRTARYSISVVLGLTALFGAGAAWGALTCPPPPGCYPPGMMKQLSATCPAAQSAAMNTGAAQRCPLPGAQAAAAAALPAAQVGLPVRLATGNEFEAQVDLPSLPGPLGLTFIRYYNSQWQHGGVLGPGWTESYAASLSVYRGAEAPGQRPWVSLRQADGRVLWFDPATSSPGVWQATLASDGRIERSAGGYVHVRPDGVREHYDTQGHLTALSDAQGQRLTLMRDTQGRLTQVTDPWGRTLHFTYNGTGQLVQMTDPAGQGYHYTYDAQGRLTGVQGPDGYRRTYLYTDARFPTALTGIRDGRGMRLATWAYDAQGRAILSEGPAGSDRLTLHYGAGTVTVRDARGAQSVYHIAFRQGLGVPTQVQGPGCATCGTGHTRYAYDERLNLIAVTRAGTTTRYTYTPQGQVASVTRAAGTPEARAVAYRYDEGGRLTEIRWPSVAAGKQASVQITYDPAGRPVTLTAQGYTPQGERLSRSWRFTYDTQGQLTALDGPLPGTADTTRYSYDAHGRPLAMTDPLGLTTRILAYDAYGYPTQLQGPGGALTTLIYSARGQVHSVSRGSVRYRLHYDPEGRVTLLTAPDGTRLKAQYDTAGRLTHLIDGAGDQLAAAYDAAGDLLGLARYAPGTRSAQQWLNFQYDLAGQLTAVKSPDGARTRYGYDAAGRLASRTDPIGRTTRYAYTALGQLRQAVAGIPTQPALATVGLQYAGDGTLSGVQDPAGQTTRYVTDDFGQLREAHSPDGGTLRYRYDVAGRLTDVHGPDGTLRHYRYDLDGRVIEARTTHPGQPTLTTTYRCQGPHLTDVNDPEQRTRYRYDAQGLRLTTQITLHGHTYTTAYAYDRAGRLSKKTLPDGSRLRYAYGPRTGRLRAITLNGAPLLSALRYQPFGPVSGYTQGKGLMTTYTYDMHGQLTALKSGPLAFTYTYDPAGQLTTLARNGITTRYGYDALGQLALAHGQGPDARWRYDIAGDRLDHTAGGQPAVYRYAGHRLHGVGTRAYTYDAAGRLKEARTPQGITRYRYDAAGRLAEVIKNGQRLARYRYNAQGERVAKTVYTHGRSHTTFYLYDQGRLRAEVDERGRLLTEYLYLGWRPIGLLKYRPQQPTAPPRSYAILTDALGTPQAVVDAEQHVVWQADYQPFGQVRLLNQRITLDQRFPGQYYDAETGLYYNGARYYDPHTGRYITPDPLGLAGGLNPYLYANGNPLQYTDPTGLESPTYLFPPTVNDPNDPLVRYVHRVITGEIARQGLQHLDAVMQRLACGNADPQTLNEFISMVLPGGGIEGVVNKTALAIRYGTTAERTSLLEHVITSEGGLNTSQTVAKQLAGPRSYISSQSILDTVGSGVRIPDPQGVVDQFLYRAPAQFNKSVGELEVLIHEPSGQIRHVLFRSTK